MGIFDTIGKVFREPAPEPVRPELGRNEPCWCGSGRKYKKCHMNEDESLKSKSRAAACCTSPT